MIAKMRTRWHEGDGRERGAVLILTAAMLIVLMGAAAMGSLSIARGAHAAGNDVIKGRGGDDILIGCDGDDTIRGHPHFGQQHIEVIWCAAMPVHDNKERLIVPGGSSTMHPDRCRGHEGGALAVARARILVGEQRVALGFDVLHALGVQHENQGRELRDERAAVMKGASNARKIWRIDVSFDADGLPVIDTRMIDLDEAVLPDAEYAGIDEKWRTRLLERFPFLTARVGEAAVPLDAREVTVRNEESNWGNFVVDQMRGAFGEPQADFAFINSGTLRIDDFIAGDVAFEDIGRTFGFSSYLRYMAMTGAEFRTVLEAGYRGAGPSKGYFPQVSGFRVCVDRSQPEGARIVSLQVPGDGTGWQEIEAQREYGVVVPDFLFRGGDGYSFPSGIEASRPGSELVYLVLDAIINAQAEGRAIGEPVDPDNPRIVILEEPGMPCW